MLKLCAILIAACLFSGCIQDNTVINIKPDGSGTIEETVLMGNSFVEMMQGFAKGTADENPAGPKVSETKKEDSRAFLKEMMDKAKSNAKGFGEGVKFESATPVKTKTATGYTAIYSFDDINKVTLNQNPGKKAPGDDKSRDQGTAGDDRAKNDMIKFAFSKGPVSRLSVNMPPPQTTEKPAAKDEAGKDGAEDPNALEMMKAMFKDMRVSIVLNIVGNIVDTNAMYRSGQNVTLIDLDFGKLVGNPALMKKINQAQPQSIEEVKKMVKGIEGLKLEFSNPVTIDFK
jgi:hypothetical protein